LDDTSAFLPEVPVSDHCIAEYRDVLLLIGASIGIEESEFLEKERRRYHTTPVIAINDLSWSST
jgi:hypothetical protein